MPSIKCKNCGTWVEYPAGAPAWMTTFGDLNALLLTFFILLLTMSTMDIRKFNVLMSHFQGTFGLMNGGDMVRVSDFPDAGVKPDEITEAFPERLITLQREEANQIIEEITKQAADIGKMEVFEEERGLVIQVADEILFEPASAELSSAAAKRILARIGLFLKNIEGLRERPIQVEGHTDDAPMPAIYSSRSKYATNWELSAMRATNVLRFLVNRVKISPTRLSAAGYGSYKPLPRKVNNNGELEPLQDFRNRNRRVNIVVLRKKSKKK